MTSQHSARLKTSVTPLCWSHTLIPAVFLESSLLKPWFILGFSLTLDTNENASVPFISAILNVLYFLSTYDDEDLLMFVSSWVPTPKYYKREDQHASFSLSYPNKPSLSNHTHTEFHHFSMMRQTVSFSKVRIWHLYCLKCFPPKSPLW